MVTRTLEQTIKELEARIENPPYGDLDCDILEYLKEYSSSEEHLEYSKVIRCKDCKFYTPMNRKLKTGICSMTMHHLGDDGFCSTAERGKPKVRKN